MRVWRGDLGVCFGVGGFVMDTVLFGSAGAMTTF